MTMKKNTRLALILTLGAGGLFAGGLAEAHIELGSAPVMANATNVVVFNVGHGCAGKDTYKVTIDIPAGVTSVRPMRSDFGTPTVQKDAAGTITSVTWQKPDSEALDEDVAFYQVKVRLKTPNAPFTTLYFAAHQTCRAADGTLTTVEWTDTPATPAGTGSGEPAAAVALYPARQPGWNQYTVPADMPDLNAFFKDAQIVWKGTAAFSANASTTTLIAGTAGVTPLTSLAAGDVIWVKY